MKHLLILLSFLLLSSPVIGEETGVLFLRLENGEIQNVEREIDLAADEYDDDLPF